MDPARSPATEPIATPNVVGLIDSVPLYRSGLTVALEGAGFTVDTPTDPLPWVREHPAPAIVLTLRDPTHWEHLRQVHAADKAATIVALLPTPTVHDDHRALLDGAASATAISDPAQTIIETLRASLRGQAVCPHHILRTLLPHRPPAPAGIAGPELEWLALLARGLTTDQLATRVGYSPRAIQRRLAATYQALGVANRTAAITHLLQLGLLSTTNAAPRENSTTRSRR